MSKGKNNMTYIHGIGHYHPENIIDNAFLEDLDIDTSHQWIVDRVGILQRRTVLPLDYLKATKNQIILEGKEKALMSQADTAKKAIKMALKKANLTKADIGMVIAGGCAPDYSLPANSAVIAECAGIDALCLDINSACSSFAAHMHMVANMGENAPDYVLLVQAENWTTTIDYSDRTTAVLIGDATVATIVSNKHPSSFKVTDTTLVSDPAGWAKVKTPTSGYFVQEGQAVQKFAIKKTMQTFKMLEEKSQKPLKDHYFISHQANLTMLNSVVDKLAIQKDKHLHNIEYYGNCASAGAPSVLSQNFEQFIPGDLITLVVVGAGLTWGGMVIEKIA